MTKKTRKMISHPDDSDDGLLGESTYEILSDLSIPSHSDDDDDLSSLASLAEDTADEDEEEEEGEEFAFPSPSTEPSKDTVEELSHSPYAESVPDVPDTFEPAGIPTYSGLDQHEPLDTPSSLSEVSLNDVAIRFNDEDILPGEQSSLSWEIEQFKGAELDAIRAAIGAPDHASDLFSVLRCSLGIEPLSVKDTFRVLYVGDESAKDEIFRKLGAALVVHSTCESLEDSKSSARFNVVPVTSFGSSATPDVELVESFGLEMAVDTCAFAYLSDPSETIDEITLIIKPKSLVRSRKTNNSYKMDKTGAPNWRLPDLAIFYCEENDDSRKRTTRSSARAFVSRHDVPFLSISNKKLYQHPHPEDFQINDRSLHMAIETRKIDENGVEVREVFKNLPMDLHSFINMDVQQLSQHLAVIVKTQDENESESEENNITPWGRLFKLFSQMLEGETDRNFNIGMAILAGIALSSICLGFSIAFASFMRPASFTLDDPGRMTIIQKISTKTQVPTSLSVVTSSTSIKLLSTKETLTSSSAISVISKVKPPVSSSSIQTPSSIMAAGVTSLSVKDIPSLPANESNEFKIYTMSEGHIVLRSPTKFANLRKPPALIVHVKRKDRTVPVELNKLFRGVYAIKMDLNEAWGVLNITIRTENKPIIKQSFVVDLGNSWLSSSAWKRSVLATSSDLRKAVNKASSKANDYAQKFQESGKKKVKLAQHDVKNLQKEAVKLKNGLGKEAFKLKQEFQKQSKVAKKTLESQLKSLKTGIDDLKIDQYINGKSLREYTSRLDQQVQKARKNANRLWSMSAQAAKKSAKKRRLNMAKKPKSCGGKKWKGKTGKCKSSR
ncbi:hypothetical protein TWF694_002435 [Orbilia ellipsospora]|uniref:Uncharacterized protein n=1 Tax=Orbilia ellipsospora TaxID=2528407 RepID=A0AAV9X3B4_9PEZI